MNESIGNAYLFKIVILILFLVMFTLIGAVSYSKSYKAKNRIVQAIEDHENYEDAVSQIDFDLGNMGYKLELETNCKKYFNRKHINCSSEIMSGNSSYDYCVCKINSNGTDETDGVYYKVVTFMRFEFPVIGNAMEFGIEGETRILNKDFEY